MQLWMIQGLKSFPGRAVALRMIVAVRMDIDRDLLSTMADPSNEEYESMKGWLQGVWGYGDFDPHAFDLHSCRLRVDDYQRLIEEVRRGLFRR